MMMDPDANLKEIRQICSLQRETDHPPLERLIELVEALDGWLAKGGALPKSWRR